MKDTTLIEAQNIDTLLGRELKFLQILAGFTLCLVSLFVNVKDTYLSLLMVYGFRECLRI